MERNPQTDIIFVETHFKIISMEKYIYDLTSTGISFAKLHAEGIDPVVARLSMAFKTPLKSGDEFISKLYLKKEGIKYVFYQDIFRLPDNKPVIKATVETVSLINGRLGTCPLFDEVFAPYVTE